MACATQSSCRMNIRERNELIESSFIWFKIQFEWKRLVRVGRMLGHGLID